MTEKQRRWGDKDTFFERIDILKMTVKEIERDYPNLWAAINDPIAFAYLNEFQRKKILALAVNVCGTCHDADSGCQCWNDE